MALSKLEGRITVASAAAYTISVTDPGGTSSVALTPGDYYLTSTTSLLSALAAAMTANTTLSGTYACSLDDNSDTSTGKVTISAGVTFSITWTSSTIRDALGFTGTVSGASTYTSTNGSPYVWLPDQRRANPLSPDGGTGIQLTDATCTMSPAGITKIIKFSTRYRDSLEYRYLSGAKTWTTFERTGFGNESFQTFWTATIANGYPVRHHPDRSVDGTFKTWRVLKPQEFMVQPEFQGFVGQVGQDGSATRWKYGPVDVVIVS